MGEIEFLGTGTSTGIPMIGCRCVVCRSQNPHNNRLRASVAVKTKGKTFIIDTGPELRLQALRASLDKVDGVLITHTHADHLAGFDDLRAYNFITGEPVKVVGSPETIQIIKHNYPYIFGQAVQQGGGLPKIEAIAVTEPFVLGGVNITPLPVWHGKVLVYGYLFGKMAYVTDLSYIPETSLTQLENLDTLVLGVLRHRKHSTHISLSEAISLIEKLKPRQAYFTHISHDLEHERVANALPPGVFLAYDGLRVNFSD